MNDNRYEDIIHLPHHQSDCRPKMSVRDRAAQFAPFAALVGYEQMVQETEGVLLADRRRMLSEDKKRFRPKNADIAGTDRCSSGNRSNLFH